MYSFSNLILQYLTRILNRQTQKNKQIVAYANNLVFIAKTGTILVNILNKIVKENSIFSTKNKVKETLKVPNRN